MTTLRDGETAPSSPFALLPLRNGVLFPGTVVTLPIGRERSVALASTLQRGAVFGVATQKDSDNADPGVDDLHRVGTFVRVTDIARLSGGEYRIALEAVGRFTLGALVRKDPFWLVEGSVPEETGGDTEEARLVARALHDHVREL